MRSFEKMLPILTRYRGNRNQEASEKYLALTVQITLFHLALPRGDSVTSGTFSPTICIATPVTRPTISA